MSIVFGAAGAVAVGTTSLSVAHPTGITVEQLLVLVVINKTGVVPTAPIGWIDAGATATAIGGAGSNVADSGTVRTNVYYKIADGTESGSLSVAIPGGNSAMGRMFRYTKDPLALWDIALASGTRNVGGTTAWSLTASTDPGITVGDVVLVATGINVDTLTYTAHAITASGISAWGAATSRQDSGTTGGNDCRLSIYEYGVTTGTSVGAPTATMTASSSTVNAPSGSAVFIRLREVASPPDFARVASFYAEALTEHVQSAGRVTSYHTEVLTEHVQSAGRAASFYVEALTEGPWAPNDPRGRVASFYIEVLSEPPEMLTATAPFILLASRIPRSSTFYEFDIEDGVFTISSAQVSKWGKR